MAELDDIESRSAHPWGNYDGFNSFDVSEPNLPSQIASAAID